MSPPEGMATHYQTTITLPKDAYKMDFVFSDVEEGEGLYDNRWGGRLGLGHGMELAAVVGCWHVAVLDSAAKLHWQTCIQPSLQPAHCNLHQPVTDTFFPPPPPNTRGGLDYNLPIDGSAAREAPLHVVHISVEMAPIAKVGGLGDVVTALARAVQDEGHLTEVILPK